MKPTDAQRKKLNALMQEGVRLRDGARCLRCGRLDRLQMSHIYPKGRYRLMEFLLENVKLLCYSCHLHWWHKNPIEAHEWLKTAIPVERQKWLHMAANSYLGPFDPKLAILELEQKVSSLRKR